MEREEGGAAVGRGEVGRGEVGRGEGRGKVGERAEEGMPVCCKIQYTTRDSHCHHTYRSCNR